MKKIFLLALAAILASVLFACGGSSDNIVNGGNDADSSLAEKELKEYFVGNVGSQWYMTSYILDENGEKTGVNYNDTITFAGYKNLDGKTAFEFISKIWFKNSQNPVEEKNYYAISGSKLFQYVSFYPSYYKPAWYPIADIRADSWKAFEANKRVEEFQDSVKTTRDISITANVYSLGKSAIEFKSNSVETIGYKLVVAITIVETVGSNAPSTQKYTVERSIWLGKGIGIARFAEKQEIIDPDAGTETYRYVWELNDCYIAP